MALPETGRPAKTIALIEKGSGGEPDNLKRYKFLITYKAAAASHTQGVLFKAEAVINAAQFVLIKRRLNKKTLV